ncbi:MAG: hypothetical protein ACOC2U_01555, partial [bacterium]
LKEMSDNHVYKDVDMMVENEHPDLLKIEETKPPYIDFEIENIDHLEVIKKTDFANNELDVFLNTETSLDVVLNLVNKYVPVDIVGIGIDDIMLKPTLIKEKTSFLSFLKKLKYSYDLHISYDKAENVIFVNTNKKISFVLPSILNSLQGTIGDDSSFSVDAHPDSLKDVIDTYAKNLEVDIDIFSETTGKVEFSGKPSVVDSMVNAIEMEVKERLKFVMLNISFITFSASNDFQSKFDFINESIQLIDSGTLGTFKFNAGNLFESKGESFSVGLENYNSKVSTLFKIFNSIGNATLKTAPSVMTANGVPVSFDILDEVGYWEPGDLESRSYEGETIYMSGKPTFVEDSVGLELKIRPKIISNEYGEYDEMDISFLKSEVYSTTSMSWQPLKREKRLSSRAVLRPDELLLLTKLYNTERNVNKGGLPFNNAFLDFFTTEQDRSGQAQTLFVVIDATIQDEKLRSDYQVYDDNYIDFSTTTED